MTFGQAAEIFKEKTANDASLKPRSKSYRVMLIDFIVRSWPELPDLSNSDRGTSNFPRSARQARNFLR